jgi:hypothetical protein
MQTFLPFPSIYESLKVLDSRRLGKQRVEAFQLLCALGDPSALKVRKERTGKTDRPGGWSNHPAALMWAGYEPVLRQYYNRAIIEWISRGFNNTLPRFKYVRHPYPSWFGSEPFHLSHQSNLTRKDPAYYSRFWDTPPTLEYVWPITK